MSRPGGVSGGMGCTPCGGLGQGPGTGQGPSGTTSVRDSWQPKTGPRHGVHRSETERRLENQSIARTAGTSSRPCRLGTDQDPKNTDTTKSNLGFAWNSTHIPGPSPKSYIPRPPTPPQQQTNPHPASPTPQPKNQQAP